MTSLPTRFPWICVVLLACGGCSLFAEGVKGRPIEYSAPPGEQGKTQSPRLDPGQTRLGQLENELTRPFQGLTPGSSLDGVILPAPLPAPPPAVQSPRARELSDKKRDWMFLTPEEVFAIQTVEDKYKAPEMTLDGRNRDELRPMARAYMDAANAAYSNSASATPFPTFGTSYDSALGSVISGLNAGNPNSAPNSQVGDELRRLLGGGSSSGGSQAPEAADFFKFNNGYKPPAKPTQAEMQRAEDFKQILDFGNTLPDATVMNADHIFSSPYVDKSFFDPPKPTLVAPVATLGGNVSGSSVGAAGTPSWSAPPPPAEPSRVVTAPASPFLSIPRRDF